MEPTVQYIGHEISKQGIKPLNCKVETIKKAKYSENVSELVSFLGAAQYYARYIPNLSSIVEPLNRLRQASVPWMFGVKEKSSFDELKFQLSSESLSEKGFSHCMIQSCPLSWIQTPVNLD